MGFSRRSSILRASVISLYCGLGVLAGKALAQSSTSGNHVPWKLAPNEEHFETAFNQTWILPPGSRIENFQFSAIRVHLGYFQLKLLGVADFAKQHTKEIAVSQKVDQSFESLFELGLSAIYRAKPFENIVALAPAGFPASEKKPVNLGLLKTDGVTQSQLLSNGPSAVLCLDSPKYQGQGYQFQLPVFYRTGDDRQQDLVRQCRDAVQVGPRILEDPNSVSKEGTTVLSYIRTKNGPSNPWSVYLGIPSKMASGRAAYYRTVIALDDPNREDKDGKLKSVARNAYIVVITTPVTLWEIQNMLSSPGFYANNQYAPYWAINLVGGDYAGLLVRSSAGNAETTFGNASITQASVLAVIRR